MNTAMDESLRELQVRFRLKSRSLIAVVDETGKSSRPGPSAEDDFGFAAVVFRWRSMEQLRELDSLLRRLTGREDYKYRQVSQLTEARKAIVDTLQHQRSLIRLYGFYVAGGAFGRVFERELAAVRAEGGDPALYIRKCAEYAKDPGGTALAETIGYSLPALSAFADKLNESILVFTDKRTDESLILNELRAVLRTNTQLGLWGTSYARIKQVDRAGPEWEPIVRLAGVIAGDLRSTFSRTGELVWKCLQPHGFVGRLPFAQRWSMAFKGKGAPIVGTLEAEPGDADWCTGSTSTVMFRGYQSYFLSNIISLFSPDGIGCNLFRVNGKWRVMQVPD